jgi:photosynthetic reaction center cytochrome c subunit
MRFLATLLFVTAMTVAAQDAPKQGEGRGGPQPHKNLKVLKDADVRPVMGAMLGALGQKCDFCHARGDFASDEKHEKVVALKMIQLVNEINAKFPDGKVHVSCYTCHRGKTEPDMVPPPAAPPAQ